MGQDHFAELVARLSVLGHQYVVPCISGDDVYFVLMDQSYGRFSIFQCSIQKHFNERQFEAIALFDAAYLIKVFQLAHAYGDDLKFSMPHSESVFSNQPLIFEAPGLTGCVMGLESHDKKLLDAFQ